ncbi:MAG: hypothetical protein COV67_10480 [Nitrospinae bacterium CG11_big_fil_rev_8_21_14_0_20_56_8]|nr:MAG: hypothetical protein COV67_10480 [Nitrospinae bacterium CG11_big_fil_rev_8_21_14_0_20_56_8]
MLSNEKTSQQLILDFPARPEFSFDNFIVSESSRFAVEAAGEICSPSPPFRSLFLFGPGGLGKTHLLISIGNRVSQTGKRALYLHCREWIQKLNAGGGIPDAQTLNRITAVDYFLLDDVEYLSGQKGAQEQLYLIYNQLAEREARLVFASSLHPHDLPSIQDYLISRFQWGMVVELGPIDAEGMARILKKLAADRGMNLPGRTIEYLLTRIPRDFASLNAVVETINRESLVQKKKVSIALAKDALNLP